MWAQSRPTHITEENNAKQPQFIMLYKVILTFESVHEILWCDHLNESYWAALSCGALQCSTLQWWIQGTGGGGLCLDNIEAQRAEKMFFETAPPPLTGRTGSATTLYFLVYESSGINAMTITTVLERCGALRFKCIYECHWVGNFSLHSRDKKKFPRVAFSRKRVFPMPQI